MNGVGAMTVRRFHTTNFSTRTVAKRRRVHAARHRMAEMRTRLAAPGSAVARPDLEEPDDLREIAATD
jgi:hypothetical protein